MEAANLMDATADNEAGADTLTEELEFVVAGRNIRGWSHVGGRRTRLSKGRISYNRLKWRDNNILATITALTVIR